MMFSLPIEVIGKHSFQRKRVRPKLPREPQPNDAPTEPLSVQAE